jgi:DNA repair photolyase
MNSKSLIKGRGAQRNIPNRFGQFSHSYRDDFLEYCYENNEQALEHKTSHIEVFPKTIVNKVTSPDVGMTYSLNPYQGCEHGCIYCYARNTHEYWGYSAGMDFEKKILVKRNASVLLESHLMTPNWKPETIVMSGNTDCYQPVERKYRITRACLKVFLSMKHPVAIITKNALILRDLDILKKLAELNLIHVIISVTSLSEKAKRILEPRTTSPGKRLKTIRTLSDHGVPVSVMMAPVIPSINSHEILNVAKIVSEYGAVGIGYTLVRLNGAVGQIFEQWIKTALPDRAEKVLNQIKACHQGNLNDSRYGERMSGTGRIAEQVARLIALARNKYFKDTTGILLDKTIHEKSIGGQLKLF